MCQELESTGLVQAVVLARLVDRHEVTAKYAASREDWLKEFDLKVSWITPAAISRAEHLIQEYDHAVQERIKRINQSRGFDLPQILEEEHEQERGRIKLFGHPVTAVLRRMGVEGLEFYQAKRAMKRMKIDVADATIRAQITAGKRGERGDPAELTEEQLNALFEAAE